MLDWSQLDPSRCQLDIGLNFYLKTSDGEPIISFIKEEYSGALARRFGGQSTIVKHMNMTLGRFGGFSAKNACRPAGHASKVILYNDIKYGFSAGNTGRGGSISGDWDTESLKKGFFCNKGRHQSNMVCAYMISSYFLI